MFFKKTKYPFRNRAPIQLVLAWLVGMPIWRANDLIEI